MADEEVTDPLERSLRLIVSNDPPADPGTDPIEAALVRLTRPTFDGDDAA